MTRLYVNQLGEREQINEVFLVADKQLRANRNGNLYLQMRLSDRTGSVTAMMWNATDANYASFENGDYLRIYGAGQIYNGTPQVIVNKFEKTPADQVNEEEFITLPASQVGEFFDRLTEILSDVADPNLNELAKSFLADEALMNQLKQAPAGIKNHHAYHGGLLEHIVSLMELALLVAPRYEDLNQDLLVLGAFLHDLGKVRELTYDRDLAYSDEGQLIGHLVIAVSMVEEKIAATQERTGNTFPHELALRLKHIVVSHHGEYEFGSPKLPMTLEAIAIHLLDNLDARMHSLGQLIRDDANTDSNWTPYLGHLSRKLFKGENR